MRRFLVFIVASLIACTPEPAPTTSPTTTAPSTTTTTLAPEVAITEFAECLESRGVVVPELEFDDQGRPDLSALAIANDASDPGFRSALNDCTPIVALNGLLHRDEELLAEVRRQLQRFAECMRANGVELFSDPDPEFDGSNPPFPNVPRTDPELAAAIEVCGTELGLAPITG